MRLSFLNPESRTAINVTRLRRCGYETSKIIVDWVKNIVALVILANGTPDDKVVGVLSYHLNGDKIVGLVKPPDKTGVGVLYELKVYLNLGIDKIIVLIDQEDLSLSDLFDQAEDIMKKIGINLDAKEEKGRVKVYQCSLANKKFDIMIIVNGIPEVCTDKHSIEDHLAKAAGIEVKGNSKISWETLNQNMRKDVFSKLIGKRKEIEELFPQQVSGFKIIAVENGI